MYNLCIGIDIGSRYSKIILIETVSKSILYKGMALSGGDPVIISNSLIKDVRSLHPSAQFSLCATGYGRKLLQGCYISEISCHAKGVSFLHSQARTIIDIGGQDSKVLSLDEFGNVSDFAMNDKCAAGTGSFLEKVAQIFNLSLEEMSDLALGSGRNIEMTSTCVVFAESEIISLINRQVPKEDILMGVYSSVAQRVRNLLSSLSCRDEVFLTGGVAKSRAMVVALKNVLKRVITVPEIPSYTGALGAALFAANRPDHYRWDRRNER